MGGPVLRGRGSGLIWALATWMKWFPAPLWILLAPRARTWGLIWLALAGLLSLITLPLTIIQLQALFGFGPRPISARLPRPPGPPSPGCGVTRWPSAGSTRGRGRRPLAC